MKSGLKKCKVERFSIFNSRKKVGAEKLWRVTLNNASDYGVNGLLTLTLVR